MYTHLTPVCNPKGQQSGLEGYILSNSVVNLSYVGISSMKIVRFLGLLN